MVKLVFVIKLLFQMLVILNVFHVHFKIVHCALIPQFVQAAFLLLFYHLLVNVFVHPIKYTILQQEFVHAQLITHYHQQHHQLILVIFVVFNSVQNVLQKILAIHV